MTKSLLVYFPSSTFKNLFPSFSSLALYMIPGAALFQKHCLLSYSFLHFFISFLIYNVFWRNSFRKTFCSSQNVEPVEITRNFRLLEWNYCHEDFARPNWYIQVRSKFETSTVSCSKFIKDKVRKDWTANILHSRAVTDTCIKLSYILHVREKSVLPGSIG